MKVQTPSHHWKTCLCYGLNISQVSRNEQEVMYYNFAELSPQSCFSNEPGVPNDWCRVLHESHSLESLWEELSVLQATWFKPLVLPYNSQNRLQWPVWRTLWLIWQMQFRIAEQVSHGLHWFGFDSKHMLVAHLTLVNTYLGIVSSCNLTHDLYLLQYLHLLECLFNKKSQSM